MLIGMMKLTDDFLINSIGFWIVGVLMIIAVIIMLLFIHETPTGDSLISFGKDEYEINSVSLEIKIKESKEKDQKPNVYAEMVRIFKANRNFGNMLLAVFFLYLGFSGVEAFFSRFGVNYLGVTESVAGLMLFAYAGPMILSAPFHGILGQKIGRKKALKICLIWQISAVGILSLLIVPLSYNNANVPLIMFSLAMCSIPWMGVIVQSFPVMWALTPDGKVGAYMGIYYTFNQTGYSISPILLGAFLSIFSFLGDQRFLVMFPYVFICLMVGLFYFLKVKGGEEQLSEDEIKEFTEKYVKDD
jgi:MFS family permease